MNVWESMGKPCSCTKFIKSHIFLLQVTRESVSGTTSHMRTSECAMGSYDKIVITIVPSYAEKNITSLFPLALLLVLHTRNNTDGNKLVIFSGIALYCGDTYIIYFLLCICTEVSTLLIMGR